MKISALTPQSCHHIVKVVSTFAIRVIFLFLTLGICQSAKAVDVITYDSFEKFNKNAKNGELVYLHSAFCVISRDQEGYLVVELENPDNRILVRDNVLIFPTIGNNYQGIYGLVSKGTGYLYITTKEYSGELTPPFTPLSSPPIYIFPKKINTSNLTYDNLNTYVSVSGSYSFEDPDYWLTTEDGRRICLKFLSSISKPTNNKKVTVIGRIGGVWPNSNTNGEPGIYVSEIWQEGNEPERNVKVAVATKDVGKGNVSISDVGGEDLGSEATIKDGHTAVLKAVPEQGYEFMEWTLNGVEFSKEQEFEWTVIGNATFEAHFIESAVPTFTIEALSNNNALGEVTVTAGTSMPVAQGSEVTLKATPKEGARFVNWTEGDAVVSSEKELKIEAKANRILIANFVKIVSISLNQEGEGTIEIKQNGKTVGDGDKLDLGSTITITATPAEGWELSEIAMGSEASDISPTEITVTDPTEIKVTFSKLPEPEPDPLPESVSSLEELRKYAEDGVEMTVDCPLTVVTKLLSNGSEFLSTDGNGVLLCKTSKNHPSPGTVLIDTHGTFKDLGSGVLYFQIDGYEVGEESDKAEISPIETSVANVMSMEGEYVILSNVRLGPTKGSTSNIQSYMLVYGKINSDTEPPIPAYCDFAEVGPTTLDEDKYYTVTGVVGDCANQKMLLLTEEPLLQKEGYLPRISLTASPADGGTVWIDINGENKGTSVQVAKSTQITLHASPAEGMEFVGWRLTGTDNEPEGKATRQLTVTNTASFTAVFRKKSTTTENPDPENPEDPTPDNPDNPDNPTVKSFKITVSASDNGSVTIDTPSGTIASGASVDKGTVLTITAIPAEGYHLAELKINGTARATDSKGMCRVTISSTTTIEAVFTRTITSMQQLRVAVDDWLEGVEMGKVYIDKPGTYYLESPRLDTHVFHAEPASDCKFVGWRQAGTDAPFNISPVFTYQVNAPMTLIAEFDYIIPSARTVEARICSPEKGTVTIKEFDAKKATTRRYITLTATPSASNHQFRDWTDEEGNVVSTQPEFVYTASSPAILTANFTSTFSLTLDTEGSGTLTWNAGSEDDADRLPEGSRVTISATPDSHHELIALTVNDTDVTDKYLENDGNLTIVMNGDKNVKAVFAPVYYNISVGIHAHGRLEVLRGMNADGTPGGGKVVDGDRARFGDVLHIYPIATEGYQLKEIKVNGVTAEHDANKGFAAHTVEGHAQISVDFEAIPAAITLTEIDSDCDATVYDLMGRPAGRLSTAPAGLYLVRRAGKWSKVLLRR